VELDIAASDLVGFVLQLLLARIGLRPQLLKLPLEAFPPLAFFSKLFLALGSEGFGLVPTLALQPENDLRRSLLLGLFRLSLCLGRLLGLLVRLALLGRLLGVALGRLRPFRLGLRFRLGRLPFLG